MIFFFFFKGADKFTRTNERNSKTISKNRLHSEAASKFSTTLVYTPEKSVEMAFGHQSKTLVHVTPKTFILNPASLQHEKDRK